MSAATNEFAKMKHLRVGLFAFLLCFGAAGLTIFQGLGSGLLDNRADPDGPGWRTLLAGSGLALPLVAPLVIAFIASRQVEAEHRGNGWLLSASAGVTPGQLCRAKFVALGVFVAAATVLISLLLAGFGLAVGIAAPTPGAHLAGFTLCAVVVNLAILAFHILLSARVENQLVCLAIGLVGLFIGVFGEVLPGPLAQVTPWGYYSLITPAGWVGEELQYLDIAYPSVLGLAIIGGALFWVITARFDHQEL